MKKIMIVIVGLMSLAGCKKDKGTVSPVSPVSSIPSDQHLVDIQLSGSGNYTSLISYRPKGNSPTNLTLLDSVRQTGVPYSFKRKINPGDHLVIRIQGDSTFNAVYQIDDNSVTQEKGSFQITGKSTNGKNSIAVMQYPDDAQ